MKILNFKYIIIFTFIYFAIAIPLFFFVSYLLRNNGHGFKVIALGVCGAVVAWITSTLSNYFKRPD